MTRAKQGALELTGLEPKWLRSYGRLVVVVVACSGRSVWIPALKPHRLLPWTCRSRRGWCRFVVVIIVDWILLSEFHHFVKCLLLLVRTKHKKSLLCGDRWLLFDNTAKDQLILEDFGSQMHWIINAFFNYHILLLRLLLKQLWIVLNV